MIDHTARQPVLGFAAKLSNMETLYVLFEAEIFHVCKQFVHDELVEINSFCSYQELCDWANFNEVQLVDVTPPDEDYSPFKD